MNPPSEASIGRLAGQVCVITAGNRGLGQAIAKRMATQGASVVVTGRSESSLANTAAQLGNIGGDHLQIVCDVADEASIAHAGEQVLTHFGRVDTVVANAGIPGPTKPLVELTLAEWRETQLVDLDGVFMTFRQFAPTMIANRSGSLIAIGSILGKRPLPGRSGYAAAKAGVVGMVRTLATELGPYGIRVNTICPGAVAGPRLDEVFSAQAQALGISLEEFQRNFHADVPLRRPVTELEVADACVYLASTESAGITGEDLNVNSGAAMF